METELLHGSTADALGVDARLPIIAHLTGGPLDGHEYGVFGPREIYVRRVPRSRLQRLLRLPRRYARYRLRWVWFEAESQHGEYAYLDLNHKDDDSSLDPL